MNSCKVVALVPIRSGSKSIPNKNIKLFAGKPLFYWAVKAAVDSKVFNGGIYVAVDNELYGSLVKQIFENVIVVMRPAETATDTATTESVMTWFTENYEFDVLSLIQVTSPLVRSQDFVEAFEKFTKEEADSLLTGVRFNRFIWNEYGVALNYDPLKRPRRQDMEKQFMENGSFYFTKREILKKFENRLGGKVVVHQMNPETEVEIDEPADWPIAENKLKASGLNADSSSKINAIVIDVDGTLTDGGMYYPTSGEAMKKFNTRDGAAISQLKSLGFRVLICTGEDSESVAQRVKKLDIKDYFPGVKNKEEFLGTWLVKNSAQWQNVLYVGDELNDYAAMLKSGISICPSDANEGVKEIATMVAGTKGGDGVMRDVLTYLKAAANRGNVQT